MHRIVLGLFVFIAILAAGVALTVTPGFQEDYDLAEARIEAAKGDRARILRLSNLPGLGALPDNISELGSLRQLDLRNTLISDISALAGLEDLEILNLRGTMVRDLSPLTGLASLEILDIGDTWVDEIEPLTQLTSLRRLDIGGTRIRSLEPARRVGALEWINLHGAYASDGSFDHYRALQETAKVNNGRAFRDNYHPNRLTKLRLWGTRQLYRIRFGLAAISPT